MILDEIAARTRQRIEEQKEIVSPMHMRDLAIRRLKGEQNAAARQTEPGAAGRQRGSVLPAFEEALRAPGLSLICEVKKASPSKGVIAQEFPYLQIAREYEQAGASAISCLTEPYWFQGSDEYLREITGAVQIPVLRKDFTIDEYMIYEAKVFGASAVLLICAILDDAQLLAWRCLAESLGMCALVEAHSEEEVRRALDTGAKIIGVNNRDLKTFQVDLSNSLRLRHLVPDDKVFVSESGIRDEADMKALYENGTDAVLVGETLMRAPDKAGMIRRLRQLAREE